MSYLKSQGYKIDEISGEATPAEVEASIQRVLEAKS